MPEWSVTLWDIKLFKCSSSSSPPASLSLKWSSFNDDNSTRIRRDILEKLPELSPYRDQSQNSGLSVKCFGWRNTLSSSGGRSLVRFVVFSNTVASHHPTGRFDGLELRWIDRSIDQLIATWCACCHQKSDYDCYVNSADHRLRNCHLCELFSNQSGRIESPVLCRDSNQIHNRLLQSSSLIVSSGGVCWPLLWKNADPIDRLSLLYNRRRKKNIGFCDLYKWM